MLGDITHAIQAQLPFRRSDSVDRDECETTLAKVNKPMKCNRTLSSVVSLPARACAMTSPRTRNGAVATPQQQAKATGRLQLTTAAVRHIAAVGQQLARKAPAVVLHWRAQETLGS